MTTKTQEQILSRIADRKEADMFGFEWHEYVGYLTFENAKRFLKDGASDEGWPGPDELTREKLLAKMLDYMDFAWGKANDCRGISANRSIMHYIAWIWLAGDDEFAQKIDDMMRQHYSYYGKPILWVICQHYGWDFTQWDDDNWTSDEGQPGPSAERVIESMGLRELAA